jgi:hypothetical protein
MDTGMKPITGREMARPGRALCHSPFELLCVIFALEGIVAGAVMGAHRGIVMGVVGGNLGGICGTVAIPAVLCIGWGIQWAFEPPKRNRRG